MLAKHIYKIIALVALMSIGTVIGVYTEFYYQGKNTPEYLEGVFWPDAKQIGPFNLTSHHKNEFGVAQLRGKWSFLFFGYTHCPDMCPITMAVLNEVNKLNSRNDLINNMQVIFITVDPERDTLDQLANFIGYFDENFVGLGGSREQIHSLTSQLGISYQYHPVSENGAYLVDHTSSIFLLGPKARLISVFSTPHNAETIYTKFIEIEEFISGKGQN